VERDLSICVAQQRSLPHRDRDFDPFEELLGLSVVHPVVGDSDDARTAGDDDRFRSETAEIGLFRERSQVRLPPPPPSLAREQTIQDLKTLDRLVDQDFQAVPVKEADGFAPRNHSREGFDDVQAFLESEVLYARAMVLNETRRDTTGVRSEARHRQNAVCAVCADGDDPAAGRMRPRRVSDAV
jgi:hypothetical protein